MIRLVLFGIGLVIVIVAYVSDAWSERADSGSREDSIASYEDDGKNFSRVYQTVGGNPSVVWHTAPKVSGTDFARKLRLFG